MKIVEKKNTEMRKLKITDEEYQKSLMMKRINMLKDEIQNQK